ncbi:hypothetical protein [Bacteroides faecichinchillae]|nr:hypothetical protein [Bacteroides faecichinchillae]
MGDFIAPLVMGIYKNTFIYTANPFKDIVVKVIRLNGKNRSNE